MPFISELSEAEIGRVLRNFSLHELYDFREFPLGVENVNIKVKTDKGTFVLRQWTDAKPKNIAFELSLMKKLRTSGLPVPKTIRATNGKEAINFNGKRFVLLEFMLGRHVKNGELNSQQLWEMGRVLAEMQLALKDFKPRGESRVKDLFHFEQGYCVIKKALSSIGDQSLLKELKKELKELEPKLKRPKGLRIGPVHHDVFDWNIKFKGNKISAIFDFGDACIGAWVSDLAVTLMDTAEEKGKIYPNRIKQIIGGYQTKILLNDAERKALPRLMLHRAIQIPLFDADSMLKQPKNKAVYAKWIKRDMERAKQIKRTIFKLEAF